MDDGAARQVPCQLVTGDPPSAAGLDRDISCAASVPLAVFDYDGTCISGQSGLLISTYLLRRRFLSPRRAAALSWWGVRYKLRLPQRQEEARELVIGALNKHRPDEVPAVMGDFHDQVLVPRYRPAALEEIACCRRRGMVTLLVSATFEEIATIAARHLGVDGYVATKMRRDATGRYTGEVEGAVIEGRAKLDAVTRWADEHIGHDRWYLAAAYGDHHSDIPLLEAAREPVAVCPTSGLASAARRRGWQQLTWQNARSVATEGEEDAQLVAPSHVGV